VGIMFFERNVKLGFVFGAVVLGVAIFLSYYSNLYNVGGGNPGRAVYFGQDPSFPDVMPPEFQDPSTWCNSRPPANLQRPDPLPPAAVPQPPAPPTQDPSTPDPSSGGECGCREFPQIDGPYPPPLVDWQEQECIDPETDCEPGEPIQITRNICFRDGSYINGGTCSMVPEVIELSPSCQLNAAGNECENNGATFVNRESCGWCWRWFNHNAGLVDCSGSFFYSYQDGGTCELTEDEGQDGFEIQKDCNSQCAGTCVLMRTIAGNCDAGAPVDYASCWEGESDAQG
jgi:hypothetical protein